MDTRPVRELPEGPPISCNSVMKTRNRCASLAESVLHFLFKRAAWACSMRSALSAITIVYVCVNLDSNRGEGVFESVSDNIFPPPLGLDSTRAGGGVFESSSDSNSTVCTEAGKKLDSNTPPAVWIHFRFKLYVLRLGKSKIQITPPPPVWVWIQLTYALPFWMLRAYEDLGLLFWVLFPNWCISFFLFLFTNTTGCAVHFLSPF